ncbi:MAG: MerR family transcriptional regulator [Armatimonadota bacterium]
MRLDIDPLEPMFPIGVAARLTGLSHKQLRELDAREIVNPRRTEYGHRLYSLDQLNRLKYVSYLVESRKVNPNGVGVVLELMERLPQDERGRILEEAASAVPQEAVLDMSRVVGTASPDNTPPSVGPRGDESPSEAPH